MTDLQTQVEEWTAKGLELGWMVQHRGVTVLTEAYYTCKGQKPPAKAPADNKDRFKAFLKESEVPTLMPWGNGRPGGWNCGFYSLGAEKAFTQILKRPGMDYQRLVASTKKFYQGPGTKYPILKYLQDGYWETGYDQYKEGSPPKSPINTTYL